MIKEQTFIVIDFVKLPDDLRELLIERCYHISNGIYKRYWLEDEDDPLYKLIVEKGIDPEAGDVLINFNW